MTTFSVGTAVILPASGNKGAILFGPFTSSMEDATDTYLVERENGTSIQVSGVDLRLAPKYTAGDKVLTMPLDTPATVKAGPFTARRGATHYVVEFASGTHAWLDEVAVKADTRSSRVFMLGGTAWDLEAEYVDNDGDVWRFTGRKDSTGMPLMSCGSYSSDPLYRNRSLTSVLASFAPLVKRS